MKIAMCISGQLRKLEENLIANAFKDYEVDYYIHTWNHELNPNLKHVHTYFPNAIIEVEKYEDVFDKCFDNDNVDQNRYQFAQFYTILKSLQLCANSGKTYDYYLRSRTDVIWPTHLWPNRVINQLNLDTVAVITNSKILKNIDSIEFTTYNPVIATGIAGIENNMYLLREWAWCMNKSAFDIIVKHEPKEFVKIAKTIFNSSEHTLQSPAIWGKIFEKYKMIIQNTSQFDTRLMRYTNDKQRHIYYYGDIS